LTGDEVVPVDSQRVMVKMWYYALTTLSTIGYGDFLPKSTTEKIFVCLILMGGVTVFSYIMGCLMQILIPGDAKLNHKELAKWIALLSKFNEGSMLPRSLIDQIEDFFEFYWDNNPLEPFKKEFSGLHDQLSDEVIDKIYNEYLFTDFLYAFKGTFG